LIKQHLFTMLSSQRKIRESKNSSHGEGGGGGILKKTSKI
jgi:hypothetical protein